MQLLKRKKSRQEKLAISDTPALDSIDQGDEATTDSTQNESSDDVLSPLADMPITEHLIELRRHLIKICVAVL
ncbi:MAG: twin-arginine translocase subunit TatC, partial [Psychrobacter nivimaris]